MNLDKIKKSDIYSFIFLISSVILFISVFLHALGWFTANVDLAILSMVFILIFMFIFIFSGECYSKQIEVEKDEKMLKENEEYYQKMNKNLTIR